MSNLLRTPSTRNEDDDADDDPSIHRLAASAPVVGGLVIKKKQSDAGNAASAKDPILFRKPSVPAPPKASLLGLDRLAALKRQQEAELRAESPNRLPTSKLKSFRDDGEDRDLRPPTPRHDDAAGKESFSKPGDGGGAKERRQFRPPREETPSHPGGVSQSVRRELDERKRHREERGVYAATDKDKDKKKKKKKDGAADEEDERRRRHKEKKKHKKKKRNEKKMRRGKSRRTGR